MRTKFWYLLILGFLSFSVVATSCSDDKEEIVEPTTPDEPDNPDIPKPPVIDVTVTMKEATVEGVVTDVEGNKNAGYKKGDNLVTVTYSPQGGENMLGDGEDYKLVIILCEGYSKIQQLAGFFDTSNVARNAPILRSLKR